MIRMALAAVFAIVLCAGSASEGAAHTFHVATTGSDTSTGAQGDPLATLARAIAAARIEKERPVQTVLAREPGPASSARRPSSSSSKGEKP